MRMTYLVRQPRQHGRERLSVRRHLLQCLERGIYRENAKLIKLMRLTRIGHLHFRHLSISAGSKAASCTVR